MYMATSLGMSVFSAAAFLRMIAIFISRSGGWMSAISPHSNRERSRSSSVGISLGSASEVTTICFWASCSALKVWKNSSWVESFPAMNWTSSISSTSSSRYRRLNSCIFSKRRALIRSFRKRSAERYSTRASGLRSRISCAIACIRWVFPSPTPP